MQIEDIKDLGQAKSICYDQLRILNVTQRNIQALEEKIAELEKETEVEETSIID